MKLNKFPLIIAQFGKYHCFPFENESPRRRLNSFEIDSLACFILDFIFSQVLKCS
jgi:hypothetical protein